MPIKNTIKTASVFATAIVCGLVSFNSDALAGQQSGGVIQLQPQTGAAIRKADPQTASRVRRQSFVPSVPGLPQISAEPIAPPSVPTPTNKPVAVKKSQPPKKSPAIQVANNSTAKTTRTGSSTIVNNNDSAIRTTVQSPKFINLNKPALVKVNLENTVELLSDKLNSLWHCPHLPNWLQPHLNQPWLRGKCCSSILKHLAQTRRDRLF